MPSVNIEGVGVVNFEDSMTPQEIQHAIETDILPKLPPNAQSEAVNNPSLAQKALVGIGRGMVDIGEGAQSIYKQIRSSDEDYQKFQQDTDRDRAFYDKTAIGKSGVGETARFLTNVAPYVAMPGGVAGKMAMRAGTSALAGAAGGAAQYVPEGGSRALNTGLGATVGLVAPWAADKVGNVIAKGVNAVRGKPGSDIAEEVIAAGEREGVPVFAADVADSPGIQGTTQALESLPFGGNLKDYRGQMAATKAAAENKVEKYSSEMLAAQFGGKTGLKRLQQAANNNTEYGKAAKKLLDEISESGDDWNQIIQTSGNVQALRGKLIAQRKYNKVEEAANRHGDVPRQDTISAIDDAVNEANRGALPDETLINTLNTFKENLLNKKYNYGDMRITRKQLSSKIDAYMQGGNAVVGKDGVQLLQRVKDSLEQDMNKFAQSNGKELKTLWKSADDFYSSKIAPYKDVALAKSLKNANTDEVYSQWLKTGTRTSRAKRFYNALDSKGQAAVRYGMLENAVQKGMKDKGMFSPAAAAGELERFVGVRKTFFRGQDGAEMQGFTNLLRHVDRSYQALTKPDTGAKAIPWMAAGAGALGGAIFAPGTLLATIVGTIGVKNFMMSNFGRRFLLASSSLKPGTPGMQKALDNLGKTFQRMGAIGGVGAMNSPVEKGGL